MEYLTLANIWLLLGIIFIIIEFGQIPGIGFLFLGLGSISTSVITNYYTKINVILQFTCFGIGSLIWFLILWYPLKRILNKNDSGSNTEPLDIVGSQVTVVDNPIKADSQGQVVWSGTIMNAKFMDTNNSTAEIGNILTVRKVVGNVLICSKNPNSVKIK